MAVCLSSDLSTDSQLSEASLLPHWICGVLKTFEAYKNRCSWSLADEIL